MRWWERAKVGDKVVCVDNALRFYSNTAAPDLTLGAIYTIGRIDAFYGIGPLYEVGVLLQIKEIDLSQYLNQGRFVGYMADRFKPVRDTTLQVENLKRLCNPDKITRGVIEAIDSVSEDAR